jgi:hydrophobic/amphiphilic exporter-1 (mainly G- bacteria), HAE1 family
VAVILPLLFAKGVAQQLFMDLFFASVGASLVSMMVALTLIPRLAAYPLRPAWLSSVFRRGAAGPGAAAPAEASFEEAQMGAAEESKAGFIGRGLETFRKGMSDRAFEALLSRYRALLGWVMDNPRKAFLGLAALMGGSFLILLVQEKVFMPKFDQGQFLVRLDLPVGTRLDVTNRAAQEVERALAGTAGVKDVTANVGSSTTEALEALGTHQAQFIVALDRSGVFSRPTEDVIADLKKSLEGARLEGGEIRYVLQDGVLSSVFETAEPIVVEIRGPDLATLKRLSEAVAAEMRQVPGLIGVKNSFALPSAETRVVVDKVRAHGYQLQVTDIARTALVGIRGFIATTFKEGGQEIDVRVRLRQQDRASPDDIRRLAVRAPSGVMVPLQEIAALTAGHGPSEIKHLDQQRAVLLTANVLKRSVEDVVKDVRRITAGYKNLADYTISLTGESTQIQESFGGLSIAMVFSVLLIYMIMAAEFESFTQPLIIMTTVPFCLVGVALTLFVTGIPLSAPVILGTIILGGLVVNNGIILIDLMNQRRREGETDLRRLVMEAGSARLRPILMTMLVSILGVLPLALGLSEGSELSSPMASVTFGGLMVSACLSLFVIPMLYYRFESWRLARAGAYEPSGAAQGMMNYEG